MNDEASMQYDEFAFLEQYARHEGLAWTGRPPVERRAAPLRGGEPEQVISALVWGDGEPEIVLLHGGGQNAHTWDSVALALGCPLVAFDLPGHGHSSWRTDADYRPSTNGSAIAEAMSQLAPRADLVVGMSLGGMTAISLAANYPHLVPRLVVVDVTPGAPSRHAQLTDEQRGAVALLRAGRLRIVRRDTADDGGHCTRTIDRHAAARCAAQLPPARGRTLGLALRPPTPAGRSRGRGPVG
jgi:pimeloyl-ACP methyl ester carboxylesterase